VLNSMKMREWVLQDWSANVGSPHCQVLLAWFRLAQWARARWGRPGRPVVISYRVISLFLGIELPVSIQAGPRLRIYHMSGIVVHHFSVIGSDCKLRHGVTIGNKLDRAGKEIGIATVGDDVDLGANCALIGDIHVGDHARIGALAVVTKSVPSYAIVVGNPGRVIRIEDPQAPQESQRVESNGFI
jgi:putative colanic acid biosynthesis acetyltransferase WcaB